MWRDGRRGVSVSVDQLAFAQPCGLTAGTAPGHPPTGSCRIRTETRRIQLSAPGRGPRGATATRSIDPMTDTPRTRVEKDSMGELEVPADALYGASTQRAVLNFPISGQRFPRRFLRALAQIKQAAAETNAELGLLDDRPRRGDRRGRDRGRRGPPRRPVPDRRLPDGLRHLDEHEHERGRRAPRHGPPRRRQRSTRTTTSTAASARTTSSRPRSSFRRRSRSRNELLPALERLHTALVAREQAFWPVVKTGRTHLQDATPIRLGQEFRGYAGQVEESIRRARAAQAELLSVPLGGTAVGTGINAHPEFAFRTCARLAGLTGLDVRETPQPFPRPGHARRARSRPTARCARSR